MLRYSFDDKGANAHPYSITQVELCNSVPLWLRDTTQQPIDPEALHPFFGDYQSLTIPRDELLKSVPAWL